MEWRRSQSPETNQIGFVPTMGALHQGHLSLIRKAKTIAQQVVVSVFVNPTQFDNPKDLSGYPRKIEADAALLEKEGVDLLFAPEEAQMYPETALTQFHFGHLDEVMEGAHRPGHFNGVATIVSKLFHLVGPCHAFFGQKDLQQFAILQQLVRDLFFPVEMHRCPIVREASGLALSSRNQKLSQEQKQTAAGLYQTLQHMEEHLGKMPIQKVVEAGKQFFSPFDARLEYLEIVDARSLKPMEEAASGEELAICIAAHVGEVRLIDNLIVKPGTLA